jgi:RHS repeat-associated protein
VPLDAEGCAGPSNSQPSVRGSGMGGGIGSILYSDRGTTREHFTYNAVGHTVALTLQSGAVAKTDLYEAFGGIVASTGQSANNRLANTKERSFTLSLDNHGFRYYDPEIGRYVTRDPIGYADGLNVYLYVHNNPINHIDPLGLQGGGLVSTAYEQGGSATWLLRLASEKAGQVGLDSRSSAFARSAPVQMAAGYASHVYGLGANLLTPKPYVEGYKAQVENTANVIYNAQQAGANPVAAASQGLAYAAGNIIGFTPLMESVAGVDIASGEEIHGVDRASRGLMGTGQLMLTGAGLGASYNNALQSGQLAAKTPPLKYHYTTAPESSFQKGLWRDSSVTDKLYTDPLRASQELGIPVPNKVIPIQDVGQFVPNKPPIVQPSFRYQGGGTDFINPQPVPPSQILPAQPIGPK